MKRFFRFNFLFLTLLFSVNNRSFSQSKNTENSSSTSEQILEYAKNLIGIKYRKGGLTTKGFDCSGFVRYVFNKFDFSIPHSSSAIYKMGEWIDLDKVLPGDLIFFKNSSKSISHIGIVSKVESKMVYFIHSSSSKGVTTSKLGEAYWNKKYAGIKRITQKK